MSIGAHSTYMEHKYSLNTGEHAHTGGACIVFAMPVKNTDNRTCFVV